MSFVCAITLWSILLNTNYGIHLLRKEQLEVAKGFFLNIPIALMIVGVILLFCYFIGKPRKKKLAALAD